MESTELQNIDFFSSFSEHTTPTFFNPTTSSLRSDSDPDSPKPQNEDEDEYVAELTRQMTSYMLQDDETHQKVQVFLKPKRFDSLLFYSISYS